MQYLVFLEFPGRVLVIDHHAQHGKAEQGLPSLQVAPCQGQCLLVLTPLLIPHLQMQFLTVSQCDLGRPSCQRCIKYGAECPGYRDEHELVFRNANPTTIKKRKKRTQQQASREVSVISFSDSSSSSGDSATPGTLLDENFGLSPVSSTSTDLVSTAGSDTTLILPQSMNEHWTSQSIPILLNVYSTLEFLHDTYRKNDLNGPLVWAAHLFSRTYVTNLRYPTAIDNGSITETEKELGTYLGKTLSSVGEALKSPGGALRDDVLATVWILTNYEVRAWRLVPLVPDAKLFSFSWAPSTA